MGNEQRYLICADSDGCAIDTMTIKHQRCFGPCLIQVWNLSPWEEPILRLWEEINLYSMSRGINRFKGLLQILKEINERYCSIDGLCELQKWCDTTKAFSEQTLKETLVEHPNAKALQKALLWSQMVNWSIEQLNPSEKRAFCGVKEALALAGKYADIAIVSSANRSAVEEEWKRCGLLSLVTHLMSQDVGTKEYCLEKLKENGYSPSHILMIGDAPGDLFAARHVGVSFYPVLVGRETESWKLFQEKILKTFLDGNYHTMYEKTLIQQFEENLTR